MSLSFLRTISKTPGDISRRTQDDLYVRGPILLANRYFNPLTDYIPYGNNVKSWRLATSCKDNLVDGPRFENATWRLWGQKMCNTKRISDYRVDWEGILGWSPSGKAISLLVPLVISNETCHSSHELALLVAHYELLPTPAPTWLAPTRSVPIANTTTGDASTISLKSCVKSDTSYHRSRDSPMSFRTMSLPPPTPVVQRAKPSVMFNICVQQSIMIDTCNTGVSDESDTDIVSELDLDEGEVLSKRMSQALDSAAASDEETRPAVPKPTRSAMLTNGQLVLIQALPPIQLFPKPEEAERGVKVIFSPPKHLQELKEEDMLPAKEKPAPPARLERTLSSHDLSKIMLNHELDIQLCEMGVPSAPSLDKQGAKKGGGRARGGWVLLDEDESSDEGGGFRPMVMTRRRLRERRTRETKAKAKFSMGNGNEEDGDGEEESEWQQVSLNEGSSGDGDDAAPGIIDLVAKAEPRADIQGGSGKTDTIIERNAPEIICGSEEIKDGIAKTLYAALLAAHEAGFQSGKGGGTAVVDVDDVEVVKGKVDIGDDVEMVEMVRGGHGDCDKDVGPMGRLASWINPAGSLRFWAK